MKKKPLEGIQVLDLTRLLPGPMCTLHLADMGAEVIKVEDTTIGDYARFIPPIQNNNSFFFNAVNRNKKSVSIDFTTTQGNEIFLKLAANADVIVESFRPGVVKKMGIDYDTIKNINPKIIYCSITGYGQTGPYSHKAGHDINFCALAGVLNVSENSNGLPNFQLGDIVGGSLNAAMGILAALVQQKMTGEGQYLDVAMLDGLLAHNTPSMAQAQFTEHNFLSGTLPCYAIYPTMDNKFIALGALEFKFWERFCKAIQRDDLIAQHMVSGEDAKKVSEELISIFKSKTQQNWTYYLSDFDCCASPVLTITEAITNEQIISRNTVIKHTHPLEGEVTQFALPIKSSAFDFEITLPAPGLGEHTDELLINVGYTKNEIDELKRMNIIK